ncbi:MAG: hypothetical protein RIS88_304 [Pseudomonadota bacterium]
MTKGFSPIGEATRRDVAGADWHATNMKNMTNFDQPWQMYVTNINWAGTWSRGIISQQELSLVNMAMLAANGNLGEFEHHVHNAITRTGVPLEKIRELLLHIAQYCGIARGTEIWVIARKVLKELNIDGNSVAPLDTSGLYKVD